MIMRRILLAVLLVILMGGTAPALASSIGLNVDVTVQSYWNTYMSAGNIFISGEAKYPEETPVNISGSVSLSHTGGTWLQQMTASSNVVDGVLSGSLVGNGPNPLNASQPGSIYQWASSTLFIEAHETCYYKGFEPPPEGLSGSFSINIDWTYTASLNQAGGNQFSSAAWNAVLISSLIWGDSLAIPIVAPSLQGGETSDSGTWGISIPLYVPSWDPIDSDGDYITDAWSGEGLGSAELTLVMEQQGTTALPLPGTLLLLGSGLAGLWGLRRWRVLN